MPVAVGADCLKHCFCVIQHLLFVRIPPNMSSLILSTLPKHPTIIFSRLCAQLSIVFLKNLSYEKKYFLRSIVYESFLLSTNIKENDAKWHKRWKKKVLPLFTLFGPFVYLISYILNI